jgi:hypothetical protein
MKKNKDILVVAMALLLGASVAQADPEIIFTDDELTAKAIKNLEVELEVLRSNSR